MAIGTAAAIAATARLLAPLVTDLYKAAKGGAADGFKRWQQTSFPKRLARNIEQIGSVKTLWSPEAEVSLMNFYHPPNMIGIEKGSQIGRAHV